MTRNMCPPPPVWDARTGKTRNAAYEDGRIIIVLINHSWQHVRTAVIKAKLLREFV